MRDESLSEWLQLRERDYLGSLEPQGSDPLAPGPQPTWHPFVVCLPPGPCRPPAPARRCPQLEEDIAAKEKLLRASEDERDRVLEELHKAEDSLLAADETAAKVPRARGETLHTNG